MTKPADFEQCLVRLEQIVAELERPDLGLESSLKLFEEGTGLVSECRRQLDAAEGRIEALVKRAGGLVAEPFELSDVPTEEAPEAEDPSS